MVQNELISKIKSYDPDLNVQLIEKAFDFALSAHKSQRRHSGDPYITHPLAVADILLSLKLDTSTIVTGLLHDTLEDTLTTENDLKDEFGEEVVKLVNGVTKLSKIETYTENKFQAENFRKLILAMSKDIRVLLVKLADRLHNMRTIQFIPEENRRKRIASETIEIYAPLAGRLGMHEFKDELEDLSFQILNPSAYSSISNRIEYLKKDTSNLTEKIKKKISELLEKNNLNSQIIGREKKIYSVWHKMQNKQIAFRQLSDIFAYRILSESITDCYAILGIIHNRWPAVPGSFKDYISTPKINKYKSIHTSLIGPKKQRIEVQIRTYEMHEFAERGIASHWKYKSSEKFSDLSWREYDWLRDLVEIIEAGNSPEHYYEFTKLQMFQDNVFCFTPKGAVIKLPKNATPIDFAYAVHTKIGDSAIGCNVNGRESTLQTNLKNGDMIEILTSKNASPSLHWLSSSKTGKARASIRRYWQDKTLESTKVKETSYNATIIVDLPHKPGALGNVSSLIGINQGNIINVELVERKKDYLQFSFDLQIKDLKNFTNLISEIKQNNLNFKIVRHKQKKNAFIRRIIENFKRN